eukprot:m.1065038 g.1065038  ORF g.1065038 m.1065038 type:complete len:86 (-) comp24218_c2_seq57:5659-5916(-)
MDKPNTREKRRSIQNCIVSGDCSYTLAAMSLGVGVFVLPLVFKSMGLVSGVLAIAILGVWSFWMQVRCPACCIPRVHAMTVCRLQ